MNKKTLLNEVMGVPKVLTPWVNSIVNIVIEHLKNLDKVGWTNEDVGDYDIGDGIVEFPIFKDEFETTGNDLIINISEFNGFSDIKDFMKSEMFSGLPLWNTKLTIRLVAIPKEIYDKLKPTDWDEGYVENKINVTLSKIGKVIILPNIKIGLNTIVPKGDYNNSVFKSNLYSTISHELLHIYQKYKQLEGGGQSHFGKESVLNNFYIQSDIFGELNNEWWDDFLRLIYLHLSFEINARVTQLYYKYKELGIDTKEEFIDEIKKDSLWNQIKSLENFNTEEYLNNFKSSEDTLKSLISIWSDVILLTSQQIKKDTGVDLNMIGVPDRAKKDPYYFFKFFEKRFHKKAEKWKKKVFKVGSLLINEKK